MRYHPIQEAFAEQKLINLHRVLDQEAIKFWSFKYGYLQESLDLNSLIRTRVSDCWRKAKRELGLSAPFLHIVYLDIGEIAAAINPVSKHLVLNVFHCLYDANYMGDVIIPHEYAHYLDYLENDNGKKVKKDNHGDSWKKYCKILVPNAELPVNHELPPVNLIKQKLEEKATVSADDFMFIREEY